MVRDKKLDKLKESTESQVSMSLLNLLTIRPRGVVSNKLIGALRIQSSMVVWSQDAANRQPRDMDRLLITLLMAVTQHYINKQTML